MRLVTARTVLLSIALCTVAACGAGGDNDLELCHGCSRTPTPTPQATITSTAPTATSLTPTPTPTPTPSVTATPL